MMKRFYLFIICVTFTLIVKSETSYEVSKIQDENELTIAILGDSMTWIGNEDCSNPRGWTYHFKKETHPDTIIIYARSGATICNTKQTEVNCEAFSRRLDDNNVIFNQAKRLERDILNNKTQPDLILIYAGANDAWFESQRPEAFKKSTVKLNEISNEDIPSNHLNVPESIGLSVAVIRSVAPSSSIVFITPIEMSEVPADKIHVLGDIIENSCAELKIPVLRADKHVGIRHSQEKEKVLYTTDGVHTNPEGAVKIADYIVEGLTSIGLLPQTVAE